MAWWAARSGEGSGRISTPMSSWYPIRSSVAEHGCEVEVPLARRPAVAVGHLDVADHVACRLEAAGDRGILDVHVERVGHQVDVRPPDSLDEGEAVGHDAVDEVDLVPIDGLEHDVDPARGGVIGDTRRCPRESEPRRLRATLPSATKPRTRPMFTRGAPSGPARSISPFRIATARSSDRRIRARQPDVLLGEDPARSKWPRRRRRAESGPSRGPGRRHRSPARAPARPRRSRVRRPSRCPTSSRSRKTTNADGSASCGAMARAILMDGLPAEEMSAGDVSDSCRRTCWRASSGLEGAERGASGGRWIEEPGPSMPGRGRRHPPRLPRPESPARRTDRGSCCPLRATRPARWARHAPSRRPDGAGPRRLGQDEGPGRLERRLVRGDEGDPRPAANRLGRHGFVDRDHRQPEANRGRRRRGERWSSR